MTRILIDTFFHMMPDHRLSRNIAVGGYITNYGRYSPFDLYHPNGSSMLYADLSAEYDVKFLNQPYSEVSLCDTDILIIPNPDYPNYEGASPYRIDKHDIDALFNYMERGGSVLLLVNSFLSHSDFWEENFDYERVNPLFERLQVVWDWDFMSDDNNILRSRSGDLTVGYGQGGRVKNSQLPKNAEPLLTYEGDVFGFMMKVGKGRIAVIGDAGLISNGLYGFPSFDNAVFVKDLIAKLEPEWTNNKITQFDEFTFGHLSCATSDSGVSDALFKSLRQNAEYRVDHHYRHLLWEQKHEKIDANKILTLLPFEIKEIKDKKKITASFNYINISENCKPSSFDMELFITTSRNENMIDYLITGNYMTEKLKWSDIGADSEIFGVIGELQRVNNVVQIHLGTNEDVDIKYASIKQGQIHYDVNTRNVHYGYDIMLASNNLVFSPAAR